MPVSIISKKETKIDIKYDHYYLDQKQSLLDLYFYVPYESLIFIKKEDGFYSNVVYSVKFKNKDNKVLYSDSWSELVYLEYFEKTTIYLPKIRISVHYVCFTEKQINYKVI